MPCLTQRPTISAAAIPGVARLLSEAGIERPRAEAEILVAASSGRTREWLLLHPTTPLSADQLARLQAFAARRAAREPLPYILGQIEFYSLTLHLTPSAIVPRPETEILVEAAIARAAAHHIRLAIDVGTGCGAIALALARHLPHLQVVATDISRDALAPARENVRSHDLADRVLLACADLLDGIRARAECITANLPYIPSGEFPDLQPEVRDFEPRIGLDGGRDGLEIIRRLSVQLFDHLCQGGFAALEVGAGQAAEVAKLLLRAGLCDIEVLPDLAGIDRVVIGWRRALRLRSGQG